MSNPTSGVWVSGFGSIKPQSNLHEPGGVYGINNAQFDL